MSIWEMEARRNGELTALLTALKNLLGELPIITQGINDLAQAVPEHLRPVDANKALARLQVRLLATVDALRAYKEMSNDLAAAQARPDHADPGRDQRH